MTGWGDDLADWWLGEIASDIGYAGEVLPMALGLLDPAAGETVLDVGCGEGRVMREIAARGATPIGVDLSFDLLGHAAESGPVVAARLPSLGFLGDGVVDAAVVVLVLEHLPEVAGLFAETARVVRSGGRLALVVNHPVLTAPDSGPIVDPDDDEVLWRWGDYFGSGSTVEPAGESSVAFHHRSTAALLTAAADAGWTLERLEEAPVGEQRRRADPLLDAQADVPRLLGARWRRPSDG
ncbi:MAG: methyltransferase domain-containing protein [Acidimicrobiia bacterium]|nr:methyltransferase domain-containing protein [Acidimicrobiia bacterium]